ncbi:MAG: DUF4007 family protein [Anaerolineae bacterium]|nr:DUF4007 family protein [Anaerolineae bacterium]
MAGLTFAKHETFYIRDGWLYKGIQAVQSDPLIFAREEAPQILGLGKNMVRSLRYWMLATQLTDEKMTKSGKEQRLTEFGQLVADYDPYQELDGTLWLIHYHLVTNREEATTWYWFFNHFVPINFTRHDFVERLAQWVNIQSEELKSNQSLAKDFDCLVRTYVSSSRERSPEDALVSPLVSLGLIAEIDHQEDDARVRHFRLNPIKANSIHPLVFLYILLKRQKAERANARQVSLTDVLREPMNAGRALNIGVQTLEELLLSLEETSPELAVHLTRTGGLDQLTLPSLSAEEVLREFYQRSHASEDVKVWSFQTN